MQCQWWFYLNVGIQMFWENRDWIFHIPGPCQMAKRPYRASHPQFRITLMIVAIYYNNRAHITLNSNAIWIDRRHHCSAPLPAGSPCVEWPASPIHRRCFTLPWSSRFRAWHHIRNAGRARSGTADAAGARQSIEANQTWFIGSRQNDETQQHVRSFAFLLYEQFISEVLTN